MLLSMSPQYWFNGIRFQGFHYVTTHFSLAVV